MSPKPPSNKWLWFVTVLLEVVGISVVSAGIGVEIATHAHMGFLIITTGSLVVATGATIYAKFIRL